MCHIIVHLLRPVLSFLSPDFGIQCVCVGGAELLLL